MKNPSTLTMLAKHPSSCFGGESANAITVHPPLTLLKREDFTDAEVAYHERN